MFIYGNVFANVTILVAFRVLDCLLLLDQEVSKKNKICLNRDKNFTLK
jgi:hypothetical protein